MKHLDRIRSQPQHIRELWVIVCTIIAALIVIAIWFHSFNSNTYALLNPNQEPPQSDSVATTNPATPSSLFGYIGQAIVDSKAEISGLFSGNSATVAQSGTGTSLQGATYPLPVAGNR